MAREDLGSTLMTAAHTFPAHFQRPPLGQGGLRGVERGNARDRYRNAPASERYLVRGAPAYFGDYYRFQIDRQIYPALLHLDAGIAGDTAHLAFDSLGGLTGNPEEADAFLAAAEIALSIERIARSSGSIDTVATTGVCDLFPGAINSVPSRTRLDGDVRDIDQARRDVVLLDIACACDTIAARRGVTVRTEPINADPPANCAPAIVDAIERACDTRRLQYRRMISRAYHDSLCMSRIVPTGMIFIPCRDGISHRPEEYAAPDAISHGAQILADTLAALAG